MIKIILYFLTTVSLCAQGNNWEISPRLPFEVPRWYIGPSLSFDLNQQFGTFPFLENEEIVCCEYDGGNGNQFSFGVQSEYWYKGDIYLNLALNYGIYNTEFYEETSVPRKINPDLPAINWVTAYRSEIQFHIIALEPRIKYRLFENIFINGGFSIATILSENESHTNEVISPAELPFSDGSYKKVLENSAIPKSNFIISSLNFGANYNIPLYNNSYISPGIFFSYDLNNRVSNGTWKDLRYGLNISLFFGTNGFF